MNKGTLTNFGRILSIDEPWTSPAGNPMDVLVKTDLPTKSQPFSWFRLSELVEIEEEKSLWPPIKKEIEFESFMKADIRVCLVLSAEKVKGKDKLLLLTIDTGQDQRKVVTNLGGRFSTVFFHNKKFAFVLNLKPAKIAGIESLGMIIAAEDSEHQPYPIEIERAPVGSLVI